MKIINEAIKNRPYFTTTFLLSLLLIVFVVLMNLHFPKVQRNGYSDFILAFEFAKTTPEIESLFSELSVEQIKNIDTGNYLDFGFMLTYSLLLANFYIKSGKLFKKKWLKAGVLFSFVILLSDFAENTVLLRITKIYNSNFDPVIMQHLLNKLHVFTWIKWGLLAFILCVIYTVLVRLQWWFKIIGIILTFPLFYLIATDFTPSELTLFTQLIFVSFFVLIGFGLTFKTSYAVKKNPKKSVV